MPDPGLAWRGVSLDDRESKCALSPLHRDMMFWFTLEYVSGQPQATGSGAQADGKPDALLLTRRGGQTEAAAPGALR